MTNFYYPIRLYIYISGEKYLTSNGLWLIRPSYTVLGMEPNMFFFMVQVAISVNVQAEKETKAENLRG